MPGQREWMIAGGGGTRKVVFSRDAILIMRSHEVTWDVPRLAIHPASPRLVSKG
jgi:hypothetical protein